MTKQNLLVAKIGGNIVNDKATLSEFLQDFANYSGPKILVHGGGRMATELSERLDVESKMVAGRRITSAQSLDIVTMTYAGLLNKGIVAELQKYNCNALGLSGADGNVILAEKRPVKDIDYGFVGDVLKVNERFVKTLVDQHIVPVFCALTHDKKGQLLNTNADTIAAEVASALSIHFQVSLYYCFEFKGVLTNIADKDSVIEEITTANYQTLLSGGVISDGMLPKMQNCFTALENGVSKVHIANSEFLKGSKIKHTTVTLA